MGMWSVLFISVIILIEMLSFFLILNIMKKSRKRSSVEDIFIKEDVIEYSILRDPMMVVYILFLLVTGIIVFYYWDIYG